MPPLLMPARPCLTVCLPVCLCTHQSRSGLYDGVLDPPLLGRLLDAGLLLLLRFALDDPAEPVLTAGLAAMEALIDCRPDEVSGTDPALMGNCWWPVGGLLVSRWLEIREKLVRRL